MAKYTGLGATYINTVMDKTGHALDKQRQVAIDEVWSVHSFEGDYNPTHSFFSMNAHSTTSKSCANS